MLFRSALRDMVPNHLFQLVAMMAMEPPVSFDAEDIRAKKAEMFRAVHPLTLADAVRGQYDAGVVGGQNVAAYRQEPNVAPDSNVETYVALRLMIDNWRWAGVPFYLRTGKALGHKRTEVAIKFKQAPLSMFSGTTVDRLSQNFLTIGIAPTETIELQFNAKIPGPSITIDGVEMKFKYGDYFRADPSTGYETLIYDCMIGDAILYPRADGIEAGWRVVQPFLDAWHEAPAKDLSFYRAGSDGPSEADELLQRDGRRWRAIA